MRIINDLTWEERWILVNLLDHYIDSNFSERPEWEYLDRFGHALVAYTKLRDSLEEEKDEEEKEG